MKSALLFMLVAIAFAEEVVEEELERTLKSGGCKGGFQYHDGSCYKLVRQSVTWHEAVSYCRVYYQASLVSIGSSSEQAFLAYFARSNQEKFTWIDVNDLLHHGYWKTGYNQKSLTYKGFARGEPNRSYEHCVDMEKGHNYLWADIKCSRRHNFICEYRK